MDGDDFHTSLQQLRQQLDFMNKRTALALDNFHHHSNKVTHNPTQVGHFPSVIMADYAQQIKHIGATVGALASQQEDRFQKLEHQLTLLSDKLDHLALNHPRFTPPESSTSSVHEDAECCFDPPFGKSFNTPRQPLDMPHATVADLGGYFYPNRHKYSHTDQQYISDASTFVGRVNRTLCTKSITNIEIFLRGSALRWFHIGLRIDGSHVFDGENGEMNMAKFCQSLILLFGFPDCSRPESDVEALHLKPAFMRSVILEDYAFPALEHARRQGTVSDFELALRRAIERYNRSSTSITVNPDIAKNKDLLNALACLRRSEFDQRLDKMLARKRQRFDNATSANAPGENAIKAGSTGNELRHKVANSRNQIMQAQNRDCTVKTPAEGAAVAKAGIETPISTRLEDPKVSKLIGIATEPYPPGSTTESCPTTPILPCQVSASFLNGAPQMRSFREQLQGIATMGSDEVDHSLPVSPETAKKFGLQPGRQLTQQQRFQMKQQMLMQQTAQSHQNAMKEEKAIHTDDYPRNISHQRSSVLAMCKRPEYSQPDEISRTHEHDFTSSSNSGSKSRLVAHQQALMEQFMTFPDEDLQQSEETTNKFPEQMSQYLQHKAAHEAKKQNGEIIQDKPRTSKQEETDLQQRKRKLLALADRANRVYQREEPHINPHLYYESGCAAMKESMEQNMTRLELGPINDQNSTSYAQMLEDHAATVAEENIHKVELPSRLAFTSGKPIWQKCEAADGAASPTSEAAHPAIPVPNRLGYISPHMHDFAVCPESAPLVAAPHERWAPWLPRGDGEAPHASGGRYEPPSSRGGFSSTYGSGGFDSNRTKEDTWTQEEASILEEALREGRRRGN
ncbi:hypothetical protein KCU74_g6347, partial [Aureobasidium melanogenum]